MEAATGQSCVSVQGRSYRCYLLRCWLEEGAGQAGEPVWRFAVWRAGPDAARCAFDSLHDLAVYLAADLPAGGPTPPGEAPSPE